MGCRQLGSIPHDEVPFDNIYITQSSSTNTITVLRELITRRGRRLLFPTPLCCSAEVAVQPASLQRWCQVMQSDSFRKKMIFIFFTDGGGFDLSHSGYLACGIPDAGDTIILTGGGFGGQRHKYVTRWVGGKIQYCYTTSTNQLVPLSSYFYYKILIRC